MADRVWLNMEDLEEVTAGLSAAISEFEHAADNTDEIEGAIGRPDGRGSLRDRVDDFEGDWNDNRDKLKESLTGVRDHLQGIIDGFLKLDTDLATQMSDAQRDQLANSGRDNTPV
ncbi:flagellar protein FlgN [Microbacterium kyungheense]|uniref:Excreted virulence factor EspC (Type VII ESX diderm) n=1 Tax=Microbacterium kyungheense TaxID=1263636 RepID=A0A543FJZ4_9MICO|nr:flagellar protein FlgN [Microbacterium kyungheense]TQM34026.1 hypothetical protein FB391_0313 [Microbacterium kyungheense]